jgi:large subunit ribosomal protein L40e
VPHLILGNILAHSAAMQIFVKTATGANFEVEVEGADTVASLRAKVHVVSGVEPARQRLLLPCGRSLEDGRTVADYNVERGTELLLAVRAPAAIVGLNIGGVRYETLLSTLLSCPGSRLHAMFEGVSRGGEPSFPPPREEATGPIPEGVPQCGLGGMSLPRSTDGTYFIDRDGPSFRHVLNYLREAAGSNPVVAAQELLPPEGSTERAQVAREARYYGLSGLEAACSDRAVQAAQEGPSHHAALQAEMAAVQQQLTLLQQRQAEPLAAPNSRKVHERIIYGLPGQSPVVYNAADGFVLLTQVYKPFGGYGDAQTPVADGCERRYRLHAVYSDDMNTTSKAGAHTVRFNIGMWGAADTQVSFNLSHSWGATGTEWSRDGYSDFVAAGDAVGHHARVECMVPAGTGIMRHLLLESWDYKR